MTRHAPPRFKSFHLARSFSVGKKKKAATRAPPLWWAKLRTQAGLLSELRLDEPTLVLHRVRPSCSQSRQADHRRRLAEERVAGGRGDATVSHPLTAFGFETSPSAKCCDGDETIPPKERKTTTNGPMPLYSSRQQQRPRSVTWVYLISTNARRDENKGLKLRTDGSGKGAAAL